MPHCLLFITDIIDRPFLRVDDDSVTVMDQRDRSAKACLCGMKLEVPEKRPSAMSAVDPDLPLSTHQGLEPNGNKSASESSTSLAGVPNVYDTSR